MTLHQKLHLLCFHYLNGFVNDFVHGLGYHFIIYNSRFDSYSTVIGLHFLGIFWCKHFELNIFVNISTTLF